MADKNAAIVKGLKALDPQNADHWTNDGLPRLDAIKGVSGLKREDVTAAAPHFTKDNPTFEVPEAQGGESTSGQGDDADPTPPADEAAQGEGDAAAGDDQGDQGGDPPADDDQDDEGDELSDLPAEIDEAEAAVLEAQKVLAEAQERANEAQKVVLAAQAEHDKLVEFRDSQKLPHQDTIDRLAFIRSQHEMRARRAGVAAETLKGLNLDNLDPRSPLDRSMARKKGFGHRGRPQVPLKTGE